MKLCSAILGRLSPSGATIQVPRCHSHPYSTLSWGPHVDLVCARGDRFLPPSCAPGVVAKVCLSLSSVFVTHVLSSSSFGLEFVGDDSAALQQQPLVPSGAACPVLLLSQQFTGSLALAMHSALLSDVHSLCLVACVPWTTLPLAL